MARRKPYRPRGPHCWFCYSTAAKGKTLCRRCVGLIQELKEIKKHNKEIKVFYARWAAYQNMNKLQIWLADVIDWFRTVIRRCAQ